MLRLLNAKRNARRRGTTTVEFALILPVFLIFVFGLMEYGRAQMIANMLQNSCRDAARWGSTEGVSTSEVEQRVVSFFVRFIGVGMQDRVAQSMASWWTIVARFGAGVCQGTAQHHGSKCMATLSGIAGECSAGPRSRAEVDDFVGERRRKELSPIFLVWLHSDRRRKLALILFIACSKLIELRPLSCALNEVD